MTKDPHTKRAAALRFYRKRQAFVDWLKSVPCADCRQVYDPCMMDFDHVRGVKDKDVKRMLSSASNARLLDEIQKCEAVCANCHRLRTKRRHKEA